MARRTRDGHPAWARRTSITCLSANVPRLETAEDDCELLTVKRVYGNDTEL
ncbi:MAG: hypothetical protein J7M25_00800 [Deltaproteobacteria bacterium]|nr:hypothetical protein [Deltaproteobacteria bacterium]